MGTARLLSATWPLLLLQAVFVLILMRPAPCRGVALGLSWASSGRLPGEAARRAATRGED